MSIATLVATAAAFVPSIAHAYWRGGVFYGVGPVVPYYPPPVYVPPPVVYAPPVYAPPPVVYAPPPGFSVTPPGFAGPGGPPPQSAAGPSCYAGPYVCPLVNPLPVGNSCWCPGGNGSRVTGSVR